MKVVDLRNEIIQMITEEQEALVQYKGLCARYQIDPNPIPEAIKEAKIQVLKEILKNMPTSDWQTKK